MRLHLARNPSAHRGACRQVLVTPSRLAPFVLSLLREAQLEGRRYSLDDLCERLRVRRSDLRRCLSALHENDLYDVFHQRLTLSGFAAAAALNDPRSEMVRDVLTTDVTAEPALPTRLPTRRLKPRYPVTWRKSG